MKKLALFCGLLLTVSGCAAPKTIDIKTPEYTTATGKFYHEMNLTDTSGTEDTYFQFRSDDNAVWWLLTADEIGHAPDCDTEYRLTFYDNSTTEPYTTCDCTPDMDCECYLYDDVFIGISKSE